jgi:hypothetical protein
MKSYIMRGLVLVCVLIAVGIFYGPASGFMGNPYSSQGKSEGHYETLSSGNLNISGTTGGLNRTYAEVAADITASASVTINVDIPSNCQIIAYQLRVDSALAGGETWDAALNDGSDIEVITTNSAVAQNTKVNKFSNALFTTTAESDIVITPNAGGSFTAQGTIRAVVYYESLVAMGDL